MGLLPCISRGVDFWMRCKRTGSRMTMKSLNEAGPGDKIPRTAASTCLGWHYSIVLPQEFVQPNILFIWTYHLCQGAAGRINSWQSDKRDDTFLELVWDCVAWSAWQRYFTEPYQNGGGCRGRGNMGSPAQASGGLPFVETLLLYAATSAWPVGSGGFSFPAAYNVPEGTEGTSVAHLSAVWQSVSTLVPEIIWTELAAKWTVGGMGMCLRPLRDFKKGSQVKAGLHAFRGDSHSRKRAIPP